MRYRPFGRTGLLVSDLCLGTMTFGGKGFWEVVGKLGAKEVEATIGGALDAGVNFRDTADVYSEGESETLVGGALAALARTSQLTKPFITSIIIGAKSKQQLDDNLAAVDVKLALEHVTLLDAASALPPEYPGWMLDWQNREPRVPIAKEAKDKQ